MRETRIKYPVTLDVKCRLCRRVHTLTVGQTDVMDWKDGAFIQDVMPYLTAEQRELLISRTCGPCFIKIFGDDPDD